MRLSPTTGKGLMGQGGGTISIDGATPASLATATGGGWGWLDDSTCAGQADLGVGYLLRKLVLPNTLTVLDATPSGVTDAASQFRAGGSNWAAFLAGGALIGVRSNVMSRLPLASLGDIDGAGRIVVVQNYLADSGIVSYSAVGATLATVTAKVVDGTARLRAKDGAIAYQNPTSGWHLLNVTTGALLPFAPRTGATVATMVPVSISGTLWVVELTTTNLTIRPATSGSGFILATSPNIFFPDAVSLSAGTVRVGWSVTTGETPVDLRLADLTVTTGGLSTGTTSSGSLVVTAQSALSASTFTVGPVEGGSLTAPKQPRPAMNDKTFVGESGKRIYQDYWDRIATQAFTPPDLTQATGIVDPAHGGTGVTTGLTVLDGGNVIDGTLPLSAIVDETASTLIGRGSAAGAGPEQEITLGAGLTMAGTVLSATATGTGAGGGFVVIAGEDGEVGRPGPPGTTGPQGSTGSVGPQGPAGIHGIPGDDGDEGPPGPPGATGPQGAAGSAGSTGPQGPAGIHGIPGDDGEDGAPGPPGAAGAIGATGSTGPQGPAGMHGIPGDDGEDGSPGPPGAAGAAGAAGANGAQGIAGIGFPGWDGDDGDMGPMGPAGPTGTAGSNGAQGPIGTAGFWMPGLDGDDGDIGMPGPMGATGATGPQGPAGSGGSGSGSPGMPGEDGEDGVMVFQVQGGANGGTDFAFFMGF